MDEVTLGELRRNFDELKTYFSEEFRQLRDTMVVKEVYRAEQDHLKDRVKNLEAWRKAFASTSAMLAVGLVGEILHSLVFAPKGH